jgi:hypothetical protein
LCEIQLRDCPLTFPNSFSTTENPGITFHGPEIICKHDKNEISKCFVCEKKYIVIMTLCYHFINKEIFNSNLMMLKLINGYAEFDHLNKGFLLHQLYRNQD